MSFARSIWEIVFKKLAFVAPLSAFPFLSIAFDSQVSLAHFVRRLFSAAPAEGLPSLPIVLTLARALRHSWGLNKMLLVKSREQLVLYYLHPSGDGMTHTRRASFHRASSSAARPATPGSSCSGSVRGRHTGYVSSVPSWVSTFRTQTSGSSCAAGSAAT
jgi:hypothetical protein